MSQSLLQNIYHAEEKKSFLLYSVKDVMFEEEIIQRHKAMMSSYLFRKYNHIMMDVVYILHHKYNQ